MQYRSAFFGLLIVLMLVAVNCQGPQQTTTAAVHYTPNAYLAHLRDVAWKDGFSENVVRFSDEPLVYPNHTGRAVRTDRVVIVTCLNYTVCDGVWVKFKQSPSDLVGGREAGFDEIDFFLEGSGSDIHRLELQ